MKKLSLAALTCAALLQAGMALPALAQTEAVSAPVYEALGGKSGLDVIVADFVQLLLADTRINATFKDVDLVRLRRLLAEQFCELAGGPCKYSGKEMGLIHEDLKITNAHFNALAEDLQIVMEQHGVPFSAQNKLVAKLAPMQKSIVTK